MLKKVKVNNRIVNKICTIEKYGYNQVKLDKLNEIYTVKRPCLMFERDLEQVLLDAAGFEMHT